MRGEPQAGQRRATGAVAPQWWQRSAIAGGVEDERPLALGADLDVAAVAAQHDAGARRGG